MQAHESPHANGRVSVNAEQLLTGANGPLVEATARSGTVRGLLNLEGQGDRFCIWAGGEHDGLIVFGGSVGDVRGSRQVPDHGVEEGLNDLVSVRRTHQHRNQRMGAGCGSDDGIDVRSRNGLFSQHRLEEGVAVQGECVEHRLTGLRHRIRSHLLMKATRGTR